MTVQEGSIKGIFEIQLDPKKDERGFFARTYDKQFFEQHGIHRVWVQESESFSRYKGTIRGLHFQHSPHGETKLISMASGEALIIYVDLRKDSSTFGKWGSAVLKEAHNMLFIPPGFANGMYTLTDTCRLMYKMDAYYHPDSADTILWNDPDLAIAWPSATPRIISQKDAHAQGWKEFIMTYGALKV
jgi:dTDP-4-dehydrorhamnose 3,5-epimerase